LTISTAANTHQIRRNPADQCSGGFGPFASGWSGWSGCTPSIRHGHFDDPAGAGSPRDSLADGAGSLTTAHALPVAARHGPRCPAAPRVV